MKRRAGQMFIVFVVLLSLTSLGITQEVGITRDKIKIGVFAALTGPYAEYGVMWREGGKVVIDELNKKGGLFGRKIEYVVEDSGCDSTKGAIAGKKLIYDEKVFALYGGVCTSETMGVLEDVAAAKIPLVVCGAGGSGLARPWNTGPSGKYVFGGPNLIQYDQGAFSIEWLFLQRVGRKSLLYISRTCGE